MRGRQKDQRAASWGPPTLRESGDAITLCQGAEASDSSSRCPSGTKEVRPPRTQPPGSCSFLLRIQDSQIPRLLTPCPSGLRALSSYRVWQWAADSTQCAEMREAPQLKRPRSNKATCHGWEWGSHSSPPGILSSWAAGRGGRGGSLRTESLSLGPTPCLHPARTMYFSLLLAPFLLGRPCP